MTNREKERRFNEREELIIIMEDWHRHWWGTWHVSHSRLAQMIQDEGYTKTHFDIEKLETWLREEIEEVEKMMEKIGLRANMGNSQYQDCLDKIAEIEKEG